MQDEQVLVFQEGGFQLLVSELSVEILYKMRLNYAPWGPFY